MAAQQRMLSIDQAETEIWRHGLGRVTFRPTTEAERNLMEDLIPVLWQASRSGQPLQTAWIQRAATAGLRLETWQVATGHFWALYEPLQERHGAGAYLFRVASARPDPIGSGTPQPSFLLQAPHAYYDTGTGTLAAHLFFAPPSGFAPQALFTNTIQRFGGQRGRRADNEKPGPADVCHNPDHGFAAATRAVATVQPDLVLVQLHGFARWADPPPPDMVLSPGRRRPADERLAALATTLRKTLAIDVRRYPDDTRHLGAVGNVEARALRNLPNAHFVHIEMSVALRRALLQQPARVESLARALFAPLPLAPTNPAPSRSDPAGPVSHP